jgi:DNA replication protein DnaC
VKAIGHEACRRGNHVLFRNTQRLLSELLADSAEHAERMLHRAVCVDLLVLDDFAFHKLDQKEPEMLYVLAEERLGKASTVLTSNRPPQDWYAIFPDPVVGGAVLDRMVSSAIKLIALRATRIAKRSGQSGPLFSQKHQKGLAMTCASSTPLVAVRQCVFSGKTISPLQAPGVGNYGCPCHQQ